VSRNWVLGRIEGELARLRPREERLWVEYEEPARTRLVDHALASVEDKLKKLAACERAEERLLKASLAAVVRECKRAGLAVPTGLPYDPF
jgi:hypothetical protein